MKVAFLTLCSVCFLLSSKGQELGLRATNVDFYQIETDVARVIFPEGREETAQRIANVVQYMSDTYPLADGRLYRKIPILLQDKTDITNGYVGLGPWRSEFYLSPPVSSFDLGSLPWIELLAIHEFRHVQQVSAARRGLTKLVSVLFGQEAYNGMKNLAWPNWYTEGDAVISETVLSAQGRGRVPAFLNGYRTKVLSGDAWSYDKARNGSYKEWIPSHYHLGFLLQNYGRTAYGQDMWDQVATESAAYKGLFYPFSHALQRHTGIGTMVFYRNAMKHYRDLWQTEGPMTSSGAALIHKPEDRYQDYRYPVYSADGELYAAMTSFDRTEAIYRITPDGPDKVVSMGFTHESAFSYAQGTFCWAEQRVHARWVREDHTVLVVYDLDSGKRRTLTGNASYFTPAFSADARQIAAICDVGDAQQFELQVLDASDGAILQRFANPQSYHLSFPAWTSDGLGIVCAARDARGRMSLVRFDVAGGGVTALTEWSFRPIGRPAISGEWIYFTMSTDLTEQVFRINTLNSEMQQVTDSPVSHYAPVVHPASQELIATAFTLQGHRLVSFDPDSRQYLSVKEDQSAARQNSGTGYLHTEDDEHDILSGAPDQTFEVKKYPRLSRPINIHSWNLYEDDPVYGVELLSENVLSSVLWRSGFQYNDNDASYGPFSELTIGTFFPEIVVNYTGWKLRDDEDAPFDWFHVVGGGLRVPLKALHGPYSVAAAFTSRINRLWTTGDTAITRNYLSQDLALIHRRRLALQHPMTRFGQAVRLRFITGIDGEMANQFQAQSDFTFPSPMRNHVLWMQVDFRRELLDNAFFFSDVFDYARGYNTIRSDHMVRVGTNYHFPLLYPDFGIAGIVYFKRLRVNAFFDWSRASQVSEDISADFRSVGVELMFDLRIFNAEDVELGFRWSHLLDTDFTEPELRNTFGFFVPIERI